MLMIKFAKSLSPDILEKLKQLDADEENELAAEGLLDDEQVRETLLDDEQVRKITTKRLWLHFILQFQMLAFHIMLPNVGQI
jgi:hypothetical protein